MRRCEAFWKPELSGCGVNGGGGCYKKIIVHAYAMHRKRQTYKPLPERSLIFWYCVRRHAQRFPDRLERCCDR